ncbi:MAG: hypothetical protein ABFC71_03740 [Methanoregula sp.]
MEDSKNKLKLQVNDLVLMNVVGVGEDGPIFGVVDRVGTMELLDEEAVKSPILENPSEQATENIPEVEMPGNEGISDVNASVIAELEARRAALDAAIQELKKEGVAYLDPTPIQAEATTPQLATERGDDNPKNAMVRRIQG